MNAKNDVNFICNTKNFALISSNTEKYDVFSQKK